MIEAPLLAIIGRFLSISVRLSGLMLFAPFFGSSVIPIRIKAVVVLVVTFLLLPNIQLNMDLHSIGAWPLMVLTEFMIGAAMGVATNLVFDAVQMAGQVLGVQMGYSLVNILDPQTQVDTTVVAIFQQSIVMLLFLRMDVHYWLLRAISKSFIYLPVGTTKLSAVFTLAVFKMAGEVFGVGVQIAAPVLAVTLVADIVLGLLGKASPQMPLMLLGPAVKSILGLIVFMATLKYWPDLFRHLFLTSLANGERILHLAR